MPHRRLSTSPRAAASPVSQHHLLPPPPSALRSSSSPSSPLRPRTPLLSSVCLCAIVKDELLNPSGGIAAYLDRILPFVHTAVIVDTGSTDGTLEVLMERAKRADSQHLHVFQCPFVSFAQARNFALQKAFAVQEAQDPLGLASRPDFDPSNVAPTAVPFRHMLVLDADEALSPRTMALLAATLAMDKRSCAGAGIVRQSSAGAAAITSHKELSRHFGIGEQDFLSRNSLCSRDIGDDDDSGESSDADDNNSHLEPSMSSFSPSTPQAQGRMSRASATAAEMDAATLSAVFSSVMPSLPSSAFYSSPALSSAYPVAIKFSCHCFDASGVPAPRSNSGLWNPRVFSADRRFSFVNLVDDYRFERLLFEEKEVDQACYVREGDLPGDMRRDYALTRSEAGVAQSATDIAQANIALATAAAARQARLAAANDASSSAAAATAEEASADQQQQHNLRGAYSFSTPSSLSSSFPARGLYGEEEPEDLHHSDDEEEETFASASSHSQPLMLPMRHFIPGVAARRKKNAAYKAGGIAAKARIMASAIPSNTTNNNNAASTMTNPPSKQPVAAAATTSSGSASPASSSSSSSSSSSGSNSGSGSGSDGGNNRLGGSGSGAPTPRKNSRIFAPQSSF